MSQIMARTEEMRAKAQSIMTQIREHHSSHDRMMSVVKNMGTVFSGKLPTKMLQNILGMKNTYASLYQNAEGNAQKIIGAADAYDAAENATTKDANTLSGSAWRNYGDKQYYNVTTNVHENLNQGLEIHRGAEVLNTTDKYIGKYNPNAEYQCKGFVSYVFKEQFGINVPTTYTGDGLKNIVWNESEKFNKISQLLVNETPSIEDIQLFAENLAEGDAIQMNWKYGPHTMIVNSIEKDATGNVTNISVVHANYNNDNMVSKKDYTLGQLANEFNASGQGMTAYRYTGA